MQKERITIENIPALLYGRSSDKLYLFIHGRYSNKEEAEMLSNIAVPKGYQVLSFDLPEHGERKNELYECSIQNAIHDLQIIYKYIKTKYQTIALYACSIGAYFSMAAYQNIYFEKCLFVSPILDMERLIKNMAMWAGVSLDELKKQKEIETSFGETLSWNYYQFVRNNPVESWESKTFILYGEKDNLTEKNILDSFIEKYNCEINILTEGEHYFHTIYQLEYLENWIRKVL